jgi:tetratricopeptide (TPR) repeat protein
MLHRAGKPAEGLEHLQHAAALLETVPTKQRDLAETLLGVAAVHVKGKDFAAALPPARRALDLRRAALPDDHPALIVYFNMLGLAYQGTRDGVRAITCFIRVLQTKGKECGTESPETLGTRTLLARAFEMVGDVAHAVEQWERIARIRERLPEGPPLIAARNNWALGLRKLRRPAEALALMEQVVAAREQQLPVDDLLLADSYMNTAWMLGDLARPAEALILAEKALAIRRGKLPADDRKVRNAETLVSLLQAQVCRAST